MGVCKDITTAKAAIKAIGCYIVISFAMSDYLLQREESRGFRRHHNYIFDYTLRPKRKQIRPIVTEKIYYRRDCANSYDWHSKALNGYLILCRCPYRQEGGRFCIFLNDQQCKNFLKRFEEN